VKRDLRLRRPADFLHTRDASLRKSGWAHPLLVLYAAPNDLGLVRSGFTVSGRVGHAVVRNRVRRRLRAAVDARLRSLRAGHDLVFIARPALASATWPELQAAVDQVLRRAGLVVPATEVAAACV
jgi:ribonuclease P protein component